MRAACPVRWRSMLALTGMLLWLAACSAPARPAAPAGPAPAVPGATASGEAAGRATAPAAGATDPFAVAKTLPLDDLHQRALAEGGTLSMYSTLAASAAERVYAAFEQRFPGIKVDQVDATGDRLVARVISEARGGKVLADTFSATVNYLQNVDQQGVFLQDLPAEAQALPEHFRGPYWFAVNLQFIVVGWNTERVRPDEAPTRYEDLADPRWKDRLMADPSDVELFQGLVLKYGSREPAESLLRRIAANNPAFHRGHSELAELLAAGQGDVCVTCFADHLMARRRRGAPLEYMRGEGVGQITGSAAFKDAPHPYTAMLWQRWAASEEGQQAYADAGRTPAHPGVVLRQVTQPDTVYALGPDDMVAARRLDNTWKAIFQLR